jgi:hypothetical protein
MGSGGPCAQHVPRTRSKVGFCSSALCTRQPIPGSFLELLGFDLNYCLAVSMQTRLAVTGFTFLPVGCSQGLGRHLFSH